MYTIHFGLRCLPFEDRADPQFLFKTSECEELLATMEYEAHYGKGLALVLGEPGTGKTLLIRALLLRLQASDQVVVLTWSSSSGMDLIRETCKSFGVTLPSSYKPDRGLARLRRHLRRSLKTGNRCVLIIDQAENLSIDSLKQLDLLGSLYDDTPLLPVILVGRPRLRAALDRPEFDGLKQRLFAERVIPRFLADQTGEYIHHRLKVAGGDDPNVFDSDAIALIHHASDGIARLINRICDSALVATYGSGRQRITRAIVAEVTSEQITHERSVDRQNIDDDIIVPLEGVDVVPTEPVQYPEAPAKGDAEITVRAANPVILDRLKRTIARAERVTATTEASLAHQSAIEKHLSMLTADAENLTTGLGPALTQATETAEGIQDRIRQVLVEAESRAAAVAASVTRNIEAVSDTAEQANFIEKACSRAERVETRLTAFAERLADQADKVQERMTELMGGLEAGDTARGKLQETLEKVSSACTEAQEALQERLNRETTANAEALRQAEEHRTDLLKAVAQSDRLHRQVVEDAVDDFKKQVDQQFAAMAQRQDRTTDSARHALQELREEAAALSSGAKTALQQQRGKYEELTAQVETFRTQFVDKTLADYRGELQKELDTHRRLQSEAAEAARQTLQELREEEEALSSGAKTALQQQRDNYDELTVQVETFRTQFVDKTLADYRSELQKELDTHRCLQSEATEATRQTLHELHEEAASLSSGAQAALQQQRGQYDELSAQVEALRTQFVDQTIADYRGKLQQELDTHRRSQEELAQTAQDRLKSMKSDVSTVVDDAGATVDAAVVQCRADLADVLSRSQGRVEGMRSSLEELARPISEARTSVNELNDDIGHATDRVNVLSETVTELKVSVDEQVRRGETVKGYLVGAVQRGEGVLSEVQANCAKLDSLQSSITTTVMDLGSAHERIRALREEAAGAEQAAGRLASERQRGQQTAKCLEEAAQTATKLRDEVHRLSVDIEGKIGKLDSHNAAAQNVLRRLADANVSAHSLIAQSSDATGAAIEAATTTKEDVERRLEDLGALTAASDARAEELGEAGQKADKLVGVLKSTVGLAAQLSDGLTTSIDDAKGQCEQLVERSEQAATLADRLSPITRALTDAREVDASLHKTLADARGMQDGLSSLSEAAGERTSQLAETNGFAEKLIEMQRTLIGESENVTEALADQLIDSTSVAEAGRQLLEEFGQQVKVVEGRLQDLRIKTSEIEEHVSAAVARPEEIVASAKAQADQLEQVCRAVGKVFSGLAKATLAAREQTTQCHDTGSEAARRLNDLTERTEKAQGMLQEWSEEALRIQQRLQRTLEACPTIQQTHSREALQVMSQSHGAIPTDGSRPEADSTSQQQVSEVHKTPRRDVETGLSPKAAEIAQLIEKAKRISRVSQS